MEGEELVNQLMTLCDRVGVEIRTEPLGPSGSACCTIRGRPVVFLDPSASAKERISVLGESLRGRPELDELYLPPAIRMLLEFAGG